LINLEASAACRLYQSLLDDIAFNVAESKNPIASNEDVPLKQYAPMAHTYYFFLLNHLTFSDKCNL